MPLSPYQPPAGPSGGGAPYTPPAAGSVSSSTGYNYNAQDPYNLGVLANAPVILGELKSEYPMSAQTSGQGALHDPNFGDINNPPGSLVPGGNLILGGGLGDQASVYGVPTPDTQVTPGGTQTTPDAMSMTDYVALWMKQYAAPSTRGTFNGVRASLAGAGYYGAESWARISGRAAGYSDIKAMRSALEDWHTYALSTQLPVTFTQWLDAAGGNAKGGNKTAHSVEQMDPAYLREQAQSAAENALGRSLSASDLQKFVDQFHSQQLKNASDPYTTYSKAPAEALQYVEQTNPGAYQAEQRQAYLNALVDMMGLPTASQRPQTPITPNIVPSA